MQYLSVYISACDVTFLVSRRVMAQSRILRLVFLTLQDKGTDASLLS